MGPVSLQTMPVTHDLGTLVTLLGREHWRLESVTVRLHVLRMALGGEWPGSMDDADAGVADAVDRLRHEELARAVVASGCAERLGLDPEPTLEQLRSLSDDETAHDLAVAADGLAAALDAARAAARDVTQALHDAAYERCAGSLVPPVTPSRAAAIERVLQRMIPASIDRFLGLRVG